MTTAAVRQQDSLLVKATKTAAAEQKQEQRNHELYQAVFSKQTFGSPQNALS